MTKTAIYQDKKLQALDTELFNLVSDIDILSAVAPKNYREAKQAFFASNATINPEFVYSQHNIDLFTRKRALYNLPVESLPDDDLVTLYTEVIESYVDKLDQYQSVGTENFIYDCMRYYGEPSDKDIRNAKFVLHFPDDPATNDDIMLDAEEIRDHLESFALKHQYSYEIRLEPSMIANALVSGKVVKINTQAKISHTETQALAHHELGVHLVTTLNAQQQPLNILSLGSPLNTKTQEGLAILCEYLTGFLTLPRLKVLALRVIAVQSMIKERDFKRTFALLKEQYGASDEQAFTITARVYRGGGFTKDFLYLQGFSQILDAFENQENFHNLLSGKASLDQLPTITSLIDKGYLMPPKYISPAIAQPADLDDIKRFVAHAIRG